MPHLVRLCRRDGAGFNVSIKLKSLVDDPLQTYFRRAPKHVATPRR